MHKKDAIECQTLKLVKLNVRLADASNEIVLRSDGIIRDLITELRTMSHQLYRVSESIALVDMMSSFSDLATIRDYVRPDITDKIALKSARHPILDRVSAPQNPNTTRVIY